MKKTATKKRGAAGKSAAKKEPVLLSGGNPQIAMGDGQAPIDAYLDALPGWKKPVARALDALITEAVPHVKKAVKWNSPLYGAPGLGWFLGVHVFNKYLKLAFFAGAHLKPPPPEPSKSDDTRYFHVYEGEALDRTRLTAWLRQAAARPGWVMKNSP